MDSLKIIDNKSGDIKSKLESYDKKMLKNRAFKALGVRKQIKKKAKRAAIKKQEGDSDEDDEKEPRSLESFQNFPLSIQVTLKCGISFELGLIDELDVLTIKLVSKGASDLFTVDMVFGNIFGEPYMKPFETQSGEFVLV